MATTGTKKKAKPYFVVGNGSVTTTNAAPGDRKVASTWNPGKSKNKYKKVKA